MLTTERPPGPATLPYAPAARPTPIRWRWIVALALPLGVASGLAWFVLGDTLEAIVGWFVAWFLAPALFPSLVVSGWLLASFYLHASKPLSAGRALGFLALFYLGHWLPMAVFILAVMGGCCAM